MTVYIRRCPSCGHDRPLTEAACETPTADGAGCGFPLLEVMPTAAPTAEDTDAIAPSPPDADENTKHDRPQTTVSGRACRNGHAVAEGDVLCLTCGESIATPNDSSGSGDAETSEQRIANWRIVQQIPGTSTEAELFLARAEDSEQHALVKYFQRGVEPETSVYSALRNLDEVHSARLLDAGRIDGRAFEVWEHVAGPNLTQLMSELSADGSLLRAILTELVQALAAFESIGLRHGGLQPSVVRVRSRTPLNLVLTDFATATLAEFDVEITRARQATRYVAPETIVGASTAASDYWSLGILVLELLTRGACFAGVHERAFLLHLVTRGVHLPDDLEPEWRELLEGLLTRDPTKRWRGDQTHRWLQGERGIERFYETRHEETPSSHALSFAGRRFTSPAAFALAAAEEANWASAQVLLDSGALATWLEQIEPGSPRLAKLRRVRDDARLSDDQRLALSLLALNTDLPLCWRGDLVTPNWLLLDPARGGQWLDPAPVRLLRDFKRDDLKWIIRLAERGERVRARAKDLKIDLVEERFAVFRLSISEALLEAQWRRKWPLFPDAAIPGLAALFDRRIHSDEDLLLLLCADDMAFRPAEQILNEAESLARAAGVPEFNREIARAMLARPRRTLQELLNDRLSGFKRARRPAIDEWSERYQIDRRVSLVRMLVLLAVPARDWKEPPHQDYLRNVLDFLEKKILAGVQRGPLIQLKVSKSSSKIDMMELADAAACPAMLDAIVARHEEDHAVAPKSRMDASVLKRLSRLDSQARTYRRDSGINALALGFPLLVVKDRRSDKDSNIRIAPALLWPIKFAIERGAAGAVRVGFDPEREVELNPAFETILGPDAAERWRGLVDELLQSSIAGWAELLEALGELAPIEATQCTRLPVAAELAHVSEARLIAAGAFFLADFPSQAVARDLRALRGKTLDATALEVLLRLKEAPISPEPTFIPERERFATLEADPSQQRAIVSARANPGLVLQGPPGTGKSQTIVNIVADCLGRGETVLVVCEKQAALEVVHKRLAAEGLDQRIFRVEDTTSDRKRLLEELQKQVPAILERSDDGHARRATERDALGARIDQIEAELEEHHKGVYETYPRLGLSYRDVLNRIAANAATSNGLSTPGLRASLGALSASEVEAIGAQCTGLVEIWLDGEVEASPLVIFRPFVADAALRDRIISDFKAWCDAETERREALIAPAAVEHALIDVADPNAADEWLLTYAPEFRSFDKDLLQYARRWRPFFEASSPHHARGAEQRKTLDQLIDRLERTVPVGAAALYAKVVANFDDAALSRASHMGALFDAKPPLLARLNPLRPLERAAARRILRALRLEPDSATVQAFSEAAKLERDKRATLLALASLYRAFAETEAVPGDRSEAIQSARVFSRRLAEMAALAHCLDACPAHGEAWAAAERGDPEALVTFRKQLRAGQNIAAAKAAALAALDVLSPWLEPEWCAARKTHIHRNTPARLDLASILTALPTLTAFQTFRVRANDLLPLARAVFTTLHPMAAQLRALDRRDLAPAVFALVRREAAFAWKQEIEVAFPKLTQAREELEQRIGELTAFDGKMRDANRALLAHVARLGVGATPAWSRIWQISGASSLRLRQVVERGRALGLFKIRPIWLVNPDVVSRIFPLEPGLFDVVVFDEASQMRVENATPALLRARRVIVSGDDKQLPPTHFFGGRVQSDEDVEDDDWLEAVEAEDAEVEAAEWRRREASANRRHVKDCEDLLALARGVLPDRGLDIHYRSAYRELIAFSNAAYYGNRLNVPVRRPPADVLRAKPIDIRRIDGLYQSQTNPEEAAAVVDLLAEVWRAKSEPPTIGVVTFNLKQTELIQALILERADKDRTFGRCYEQESKRTADGEDVGFFIRNLENVQGDERDWIIFSTTFGRNKAGAFIRNYGVLGQAGGERRLNVAVTRAKEKVVLVTSMPTGEISPTQSNRRMPHRASEYLQAYMRYAEHIDDGAFGAASDQLKAFSPERRSDGLRQARDADALISDALQTLLEAGFKATLMEADDAFAVDIAVSNETGDAYCLGVEFDGPRHSLLTNARARDIWRPKLLARSGMQVHRLLSAAWVENPIEERRRLIDTARAAKEARPS